jgi:release factor glutamine methyltransferase
VRVDDPMLRHPVEVRAEWHRRLVAAGCVNANGELAEIVRALDDPADVERAVSRRAEGRPLAQVCGRATCCGVALAVGEDVFVPRRRAEALARAAVRCAGAARVRVVVELGCGVGPVAALVATTCPDLEVHATDVTDAAVSCARVNGERYGFSVHQGDWWAALPHGLRGRVDVAACYLPHVPSGELPLLGRDAEWEPRTSFDGGPDGLDHWRPVARDARGWLAPGGVLVTLLHDEQVAAADGIAARHGLRRVGRDPGYERADAVVTYAPAALPAVC